MVDSVAIEGFVGEASGLAGACAEEGEVLAANLGAVNDFDLLDQGVVDQEGFLNANARGDFADGDASGVGILAVGADHDAFEDLRAELVAFFDFLGHAHGVTGADVDHGSFFLLVANELQICKTHKFNLYIKTVHYCSILFAV